MAGWISREEQLHAPDVLDVFLFLSFPALEPGAFMWFECSSVASRPDLTPQIRKEYLRIGRTI